MPNTLEQLIIELNQQKVRAQVAAYNVKHHVNDENIQKQHEADKAFEQTLQTLAQMGYVVNKNLLYDKNDNVYRIATRTSFL